jgi:hypothetical protein
VVRWARRTCKRDFYPALAAPVGPVQNIFFLTAHYFNLCAPIAQQPGYAVVQGRPSPNMCLWFCTIAAPLYSKFPSQRNRLVKGTVASLVKRR